MTLIPFFCKIILFATLTQSEISPLSLNWQCRYGVIKP